MKYFKITLVSMAFLMIASSDTRAQAKENEDIIDTSIDEPEAEAEMHGAVNGSITGDGDETLAGVLINLSGGEINQQLMTTANGWYQFVDVEPGEYQLTVNAEGYETETAKVKIQSGDTSKVNAKLKAK